ncbi:MAG TPA: UDP-N-acetylglucosamine 1-carboxyvinyltransferase, partial [Candidatus Paceibacterota bacterium]|nr:UDP-N-acetylglucosamine 1-carboxyvinyltransferase [Candidatus Paceibacterota bacterium]
MKEKFLIRGLNGKKKLEGSIPVGGAKNAAIKLFAASLLFKSPVTLGNVPDIEDTRRITEILEDLGAVTERLDRRLYRVNTKAVAGGTVNPEMAKRIRASIVLTGPLLARFGEVILPHPGGDVIGARPIDFFLAGFQRMGASVEWKNDRYRISARGKKKLRGAEIFFPMPSVTGTETFMMAGVLAEGKTVIKNAAMEPEIEELAEFLRRGGASITGAGTPVITIEGGELLSSKKPWQVMPDRIEAGSFLFLGALAAKNLEITDCVPEHLESVIHFLRQSGVPIETGKDSIRISGNTEKSSLWRGVNLKTHEYPGFPTDLQAPAVVYLTQVKGESLVFETIWDGRLNYTEDLVAMGADIKIWDAHRALVKGPTPLRGRELEGPDIRAGLA